MALRLGAGRFLELPLDQPQATIQLAAQLRQRRKLDQPPLKQGQPLCQLDIAGGCRFDALCERLHRDAYLAGARGRRNPATQLFDGVSERHVARRVRDGLAKLVDGPVERVNAGRLGARRFELWDERRPHLPHDVAGLDRFHSSG